MEIRLLVGRAGVDFSQSPGDVISVAADEGRRMIDAGQAELVRDAVVERAVSRAKPEKAVRR